MTKLVAITGAGPREEKPVDADRLVEGSPRTISTLDYARDDKVFAGEWSASVGAWRVKYEEWEFCHVLAGVCELVPDGGVAQRYSAGDSFIIEPGFSGVWRVIEPMKKRYVVRYD
ncbi:MAG: cupin domain-containing protein [Caulobacteraceae bacterium]|nr:cupin domain-containing protein [Caulobacteraceae bacterium]